jgi:hypothetical protein
MAEQLLMFLRETLMQEKLERASTGVHMVRMAEKSPHPTHLPSSHSGSQALMVFLRGVPRLLGLQPPSPPILHTCVCGCL